MGRSGCVRPFDRRCGGDDCHCRYNPAAVQVRFDGLRETGSVIGILIYLFDFIGGRTRARTWDPLIKSQIFIAIFQRLTRKKYENHSISFQSLRPKKEKAFSERGEPISAAVGALAHSAAQRLADNGGAQLQAGCGT